MALFESWQQPRITVAMENEDKVLTSRDKTKKTDSPQ